MSVQNRKYWNGIAAMRAARPVWLLACQQAINLFLYMSLICEMKILPPVLNQV